MNVAEDFNLSQSALSKIIKKMEDELGAALFDRSGRSVKLTVAGKQLLKDYLDMEPYYNTMKLHMKEMSSTYRIKVVLGMPGGALNLNNILEMFMLEQPQIPIEVICGNDNNRIKTAREATHSTETCVSILHKSFPCSDDSYVELTDDDPLLCFLPHGHPLTQKNNITLMDLLSERIYTNGWGMEILNELSKTEHVVFDNVRETPTDHRESILWNVSAGRGITIFHKSDVLNINLDRVTIRPISDLDKTPIIFYMNDKAKDKQSCTILRNYLLQAVAKELDGASFPFCL